LELLRECFAEGACPDAGPGSLDRDPSSSTEQRPFNSLLNGLRDDFRPEGTLEEILVEKLASIIWRYRRLLMAEGAEIRKGTDFFHLEEIKRIEEDEIRFVNSKEEHKTGMLSKISNPYIITEMY
jgi:hypothetical protein